MNDKKLLYISNRVFWPPIGGHEVEMFHYCRGLHEQYRYCLDVYTFETPDMLNLADKPKFLNRIYAAHPISKAAKIKNLLCQSAFGKQKWPLQCSLYYSDENVAEIQSLTENNQYDSIIVDMVRLAPYFEAFQYLKCKKILDIDDTLSKRYRRQLDSMGVKTNIAGQYNNKLPTVLQKLLRSSAVKRFVLNREISRMEWAETYYSGLYDYVIFVSPIETEEFNRKNRTEKAVTVSLGVDYPFYSEKLPVVKQAGTATFVGNMATAANADSVRMIIDKVLTHCKKLKKLVLIGNCPEELSKEYCGNERVHFIGKVPDLRATVEVGQVFLAPLAYGTGIKTKILEAMAMGMPVVTNSVGAEGILGQNGVQWFVSDDAAQIGKYVDLLLDSPEVCERIGKEAQAFVKAQFQWETIFHQFAKLGL